jgi:antitoxin ParD1/3/4
MHINLTPQLEAMVREKVASGRYTNASEAICEALRLMEDHERIQREVLLAALSTGQRQLDCGEGLIYTSGSLDTIKHNADRKLESGRTLKPDIQP